MKINDPTRKFNLKGKEIQVSDNDTYKFVTGVANPSDITGLMVKATHNNEVYNSARYGEYMAKYAGDDRSMPMYVIKFKNTGYETLVPEKNLGGNANVIKDRAAIDTFRRNTEPYEIITINGKKLVVLNEYVVGTQKSVQCYDTETETIDIYDIRTIIRHAGHPVWKGDVKNMTELVMFGATINTQDTELTALKAITVGNMSKKQLMERWGFDKQRASKVFQARSTISKMEDELNKVGVCEVNLKNINTIIKKIMYYVCGEAPGNAVGYDSVKIYKTDGKYYTEKIYTPSSFNIPRNNNSETKEEPTKQKEVTATTIEIKVEVNEPESNNNINIESEEEKVTTIEENNKKEETEAKTRKRVMVTAKITELVLRKYYIDGVTDMYNLSEISGVSYSTCHRIVRKNAYEDKYPSVYNKVRKEFEKIHNESINMTKDNSTDSNNTAVEATPEKAENITTPNISNSDKTTTESITPICSYWIPCALVSDRHEMPINVNKAIFRKALTPELMSSYDGIDGVINAFINNVFKNEVHGIQCYVTGVQAPLAALVKICGIRKINLILMHYNPNTGEFQPQIIWNCFDGYVDLKKDISYAYSSFLKSHSYATISNCDFYDIHDCYVVTKIEYSAIRTNEIVNKTGIITQQYDDMAKIYADEVSKMIINGPAYTTIYADKITFNDDGTYNRSRVGMTKNF